MPIFWRRYGSEISWWIADGRTSVPLELEANDAIFLMFRKPAVASSFRTQSPRYLPLKTIDGPWQLSFPPAHGAPASATFATLKSWSVSDDPGIRYFSGTARYSKSVSLGDLRTGGRLLLDLGRVANVAEVFVNGRSAGIAWKAPYRVEIGGLVRKGENRIEIAVANLWRNRLIGDLQPGANGQFAISAYNPFTKDSPLIESGLVGPVKMIVEATAADER
ncbi:glycosylhydrolase-like jelly roll fold domain-containing protein [Sphingomonas sp.]|uniref:glycosylhydrolase-like jelly roll fold domain-containing protein n=1 Tax=Sphingomonas sp. TaxID=28214 RepID=UPI001ECFE456|nr:glycosylhydrolase-like jelly roll fold domain-containing protein [Sphingomonas sp.]MBX3594133.1 hypothetical protein [Sphingomonas sp.]